MIDRVKSLESSLAPTLAEILAALSHALDLTEGQPRGHAVRTCVIATRLAETLELDERHRTSLFFASLIKDAGCSTNATRIQEVFGGDEQVSKRNVKFVDWSNPVQAAIYGLTHAEKGKPMSVRVRKMLGLVTTPPGVMDEVTAARCARGAEIATQLGFDPLTAEAVRHLDEHWDGRGSPSHLEKDEIPLLARILCLSQTFELFVSEFGLQAGIDMVQGRRGRWFDPEIADAAIRLAYDRELWQMHAEHKSGEDLPLAPPPLARTATEADVDEVCRAFASIVDAKSEFTGQHSARVMGYSVEIAEALDLGQERIATLRRAALLHDIGKLGISNAILDKPGQLTDDEFAKVKQHPRFSYEILSRIRGFARLADIAGAHHERLDGRGYWRGMTGGQLDREMRILAVADVFDALSADRPYRGAMPMEQVFRILDGQAGTGLDADCVEVLREKYGPRVLVAG